MSVPNDELLRRIPFFRRLSPALRARIAAVARIKAYDRGELIQISDLGSARIQCLANTPVLPAFVNEITS